MKLDGITLSKIFRKDMMVCIKCVLAYMETKQEGKKKEVSEAEKKKGL